MKLLETDDYILINVIVLFLAINFNLEVGTIYAMMALIDWFSYYLAFDKSVFSIIPIERDKSNRIWGLTIGAGSFIVFYLAAAIIVPKIVTSAVVTDASPFSYISSLIAQTFSATPVLYGSKFMKVAVWGLLIPVLETRFFFRTMLQWGLHSANQSFPKSIFSWQAWFVSAFFGALFSVFHIVAKGITNNSALVTTFLFGFVSTMMVIYFREALQAIFMHIMTNTVATLNSLGINIYDGAKLNMEAVGILSAVVLAGYFLLFLEFPLINKIPRLNI